MSPVTCKEETKVSYRCQACGAAVPPNRPRLAHVIHYGSKAPPAMRGQVAREVPVCEECHFRLAHGATLAQLAAEGAAHREAEARGKRARRAGKKALASATRPATFRPQTLPSLVGHAVALRGREVKATPRMGSPPPGAVQPTGV